MKILVIGAGPSGLMMAGELARHGVACRVVDRNDGQAKESRALGVQARTLQVFESIGLADELLACGVPISKGHLVVDGKEVLELPFDEIPGKYNYILSVPQNETERILLDRLHLQGVAVERNTEVVEIVPGPESVYVRFASGEEGRFDYLLGCDGAHSIVRRSLDLRFEGDEVAQGFWVADLKIAWDRSRDMYLLASEAGFLAAFPLPGDRWRLIASATNDASQPLDLDEIEDAFAKRSPYGGRIYDVAWMSRFAIHERVVDRLREGRCFVVGDAAHVHSPAGGQGMNTGLQDAHNLAWKLALVISGKAKESLLDSYNDERYPVDRSVVNVTRSLLQFGALGGPVLGWIRSHLAPHMIAIPAVRNKLMVGISEQSVGYGTSPIVGLGGGEWADAGLLPGSAHHLLVGRGATNLAPKFPGLCEARETGDPLRVVRPDGYVGATEAISLEGYFEQLGVLQAMVLA